MTQTLAFTSRQDIRAVTMKQGIEGMLETAELKGVNRKTVQLVSITPGTHDGEPTYEWRFTAEDATA